MLDWTQYYKCTAALCAWKEARGEGRDGMRAVLHVINNRAKLSGKSWPEIVYAPLQFTSMTYGKDPELCLVPVTPDGQFATAYDLADAVYQGTDPDITNGATHYFNPNIVLPSWAAKLTQVATIGHHIFFK